METAIQVSPTPTLRIHKDHPKSQIIGHVNTAIQTRQKTKNVDKQSFIAIIHQKTNPDLLQFCLFSCFLSQIESKKVVDALNDEIWVEAMQEELLQFKIQNVWDLVDCLDETISSLCFLYGFTLYQMNVKSAFLYGTIDEEVYVKQPPSFEDPNYPHRVYKVKKAMYGLHQDPRAWHKREFLLVQVYEDDIIFGSSNAKLCKDFKALMHDKFQMSAMGELTFFLGLQVLQKKDGIFLSQDKYVGDILKKFGYTYVKTAKTPMDRENPWGKDGPGKDVDLHLYRSMIGSLMYLIASRPDIMYLNGHPMLGLWYPRESPFHLVAFLDSDYDGDNHDRTSTIGGCQFFGRRLISWQCKKQTIMATSITEVKYVAAASYDNVADLLTKPFDVGRFQYLVVSIGMLNP
ncbi:putative ribonuclease H-like domain-containing protein [Tanacetum coccineum]